MGEPKYVEGEASLDMIGGLSGDGLIKGDGTNACIGDCRIGVL